MHLLILDHEAFPDFMETTTTIGIIDDTFRHNCLEDVLLDEVVVLCIFHRIPKQVVYLQTR